MTTHRPYSTGLGKAIKPVSLRQLAEAAGVSYSFMSKVASGQRRCTEAVAQAVRELLGVEPSDVFPRF